VSVHLFTTKAECGLTTEHTKDTKGEPAFAAELVSRKSKNRSVSVHLFTTKAECVLTTEHTKDTKGEAAFAAELVSRKSKNRRGAESAELDAEGDGVGWLFTRPWSSSATTSALSAPLRFMNLRPGTGRTGASACGIPFVCFVSSVVDLSFPIEVTR
jgi:hypothetical protein